MKRLRIVGYDKFIALLKAAYGLRVVGVPSTHVLVISPPGTGKTSMAKLFSKALGATFVRTTGRYDMLPEDFIAEKEIVYDGGNPKIVWKLRTIGKLLLSENSKPGIWFFDEFDKMNRKSMMSLLELMEEQQVTLPTGDTYRLNFLLIAAGNSRKYDKDASPIPRSVRDRFAVYWELGYLPVDLEVEVLEQGINQMLGVDVEPSNQFNFTFDRNIFDKNLAIVKKRYGGCFVRAVSYLRTHKLVEEPPGPRAYIHSTLLAASLTTIGYGSIHDSARLAFIASTAGKITVSADTNPFEVCEEGFEKFCVSDGGIDRGKSQVSESNDRTATAVKVRALLDSEKGHPQGGGRTYSTLDVSKYLMSLGDRVVMTSRGAIPAKIASKLVLSGTISEVVVPGGPTIKIVGSAALTTHPIHSCGLGREEVELTYSKRELDMVKTADLLASIGVDAAELHHIQLTDPNEVLVKAIDVVSSKKNSPLYPQLKSSLRNLMEILSDVISSREGDRLDTLSSHIRKFSRVGEFEELTDSEKHRLHVVRTLHRLAFGNLRSVYKSFTEFGRRYVILFDRSGSMSETYVNTTKKALGALVVALISKCDPEAKFTLIAFDTTAKIVTRDGSQQEVLDALLEIEPRGGTYYKSAVETASKIMDEGDVLVLVGDFMDTSRPKKESVEAVKLKASSVLLIPVGKADEGYAKYMADQLGGKIYIYKQGAFVRI